MKSGFITFHLGHPAIHLLVHLKTCFPLLFKSVDVDSLHCDVCESAKHHWVSFPLSNTRLSTPFVLVHSDIWAPYKVPNILGATWFVSFIDDCTRIT